MTDHYDQEQFYLVWKEGSDRNTPTHKHESYIDAIEEASRLCRINGGIYHVLSHQATVERNDVVIKEVLRAPF